MGLSSQHGMEEITMDADTREELRPTPAALDPATGTPVITAANATAEMIIEALTDNETTAALVKLTALPVLDASRVPRVTVVPLLV